jgi:hypothetical protein
VGLDVAPNLLAHARRDCFSIDYLSCHVEREPYSWGTTLRTMRNGLLAVALLAVLVCAAPASAADRLVVGIGDQKSQMFTDPRLPWLGIRHARLVVPWYVAEGTNPSELAYVQAWLRAARKARIEPLVGFGHGFEGAARIYLPEVAEYRRAVRTFRRRFPQVKRYITWNEANHCSQPTCRRPERVAAYYDALAGVCKGCTIIGAAVIDQPNMVGWLRRFRKAARREPRIYGLHNYLDVNRLRTSGTRRLLRALPRRARVWITETGGVVRRKHFRNKASFPENPAHAGQVTRFVLQTARALARIDRVYLYHWNVDRDDATWDSGLIDPRGRTRPGFTALARALGRDPRRVPALPVLAPPASRAPAVAQNPPPAEQQPAPGQQPSPQQSPPPNGPPPGCGLAVLCDRPLGKLFGAAGG